MLHIFYSDTASDDIDEIAAFIAKENTEAAKNVLLSIKNTLDLLVNSPHIGIARDCNNPDLSGLRMHPVKRYPHYYIYYIPDQLSLTVIRVIHSARDNTRFFH